MFVNLMAIVMRALTVINVSIHASIEGLGSDGAGKALFVI